MGRKIKKILNGIKNDFLGIDFGSLIIEWLLGIIPFIIFLAIFFIPIAIPLSFIPTVGKILISIILYLFTCFWGAYFAVGQVRSRFNRTLNLRELAKRWDELSNDEINKIEDTIKKTLDDNKGRLIKIMGEDKFYHKYEEPYQEQP